MIYEVHNIRHRHKAIITIRTTVQLLAKVRPTSLPGQNTQGKVLTIICGRLDLISFVGSNLPCLTSACLVDVISSGFQLHTVFTVFFPPFQDVVCSPLVLPRETRGNMGKLMTFCSSRQAKGCPKLSAWYFMFRDILASTFSQGCR